MQHLHYFAVACIMAAAIDYQLNRLALNAIASIVGLKDLIGAACGRAVQLTPPRTLI